MTQTYGIPTYDGLFKYILSDDSIRPSFFHAFIPDLHIQSSQRLDDHMNPFEQFQVLRDFLHKEENSHTVRDLSQDPDMQVFSYQTLHPQATTLLKELVSRFDELKEAFPQSRYNGTMDFVCELDNGEYAMVEMQVIPHDYWDRRALAYVAGFYGHQLRKGGHWKNIRKVIGLNILGGGKNNTQHWPDTSGEFVRHYKFQEQLHGNHRTIDGIELIQYSIMNAPQSLSDQERQDWITFFKKGHDMNEAEVKASITTPAVLQAFERAKLLKLPKQVKVQYDAEDEEYDRYSEYTQEQKDKAREKGKVEGIEEGKTQMLQDIALKMIEANESDAKISAWTGLSVGDIGALRQSVKE